MGFVLTSGSGTILERSKDFPREHKVFLFDLSVKILDIDDFDEFMIFMADYVQTAGSSGTLNRHFPKIN